ncbi:TPA: DUF1240 domain-containing protein [Morganella morganii]
MNTFKAKKRIGMFFVLLFLILPLIIGGIYISIDSIHIYFSFPDDFVFSSFTIYGLASAFIFAPIIFLSAYPICFGRMAPILIQKKASKVIVFSFFVSIASQLFFKLYFESELKNRGYIACQGTPLGWTPMMATKYVTDKKLCLAPKK